MILNSHNSLPQSTAAKGAAATLWCLICNITASNLLICISRGTIACLSCSSACLYVCVASQSVCLSVCLSLYVFKILIHNTHIQGTCGVELVSGEAYVCIIHGLWGTSILCKQCTRTCILLVILHFSKIPQNKTYHWLYLPESFIDQPPVCQSYLSLSLFPSLRNCYRYTVSITMEDVVCRKQSVLLLCSNFFIIFVECQMYNLQGERGTALQVCFCVGE